MLYLDNRKRGSVSVSILTQGLQSLVFQIQKLEEAVQSTKDKLEESRELLKTNENGVCECQSTICLILRLGNML